MASITHRNGRYRALVRRAGLSRCRTFPTKKQAKVWAARQEAELDLLRSTGVLPSTGITLEDLIDRYEQEIYPLKPWGRSKSAILRRLKKDCGAWPVGRITSATILAYMEKRRRDGAGPVSLAGIESTLYGVLTTARGLWTLDIPVQAAEEARKALRKSRAVGKSKRRDRRVADNEFQTILDHFAGRLTSVPIRDILEFCLATGMRISEVCRLRWADLDRDARTIVIRDRKHPSDRLGNDQVVPLLDATGHDAFAIAMRQPKGSRIFPYNSRTVSKYFSGACTVLGIDDLRLHDLRHEAVSRLFEAGYRIEQVALVSGHRDWAMLRRYTHVKATDLHRRSQSG